MSYLLWLMLCYQSYHNISQYLKNSNKCKKNFKKLQVYILASYVYCTVSPFFKHIVKYFRACFRMSLVTRLLQIKNSNIIARILPAYESPDILNLFNSSKILFFPVSILFMYFFFIKQAPQDPSPLQQWQKVTITVLYFRTKKIFRIQLWASIKKPLFYRKLNLAI